MEKQDYKARTIIELKNEYVSMVIDEITYEDGSVVLFPHILNEKWNKKVRRYMQQLALAVYPYLRDQGYKVMATYVKKEDYKHMKYLATIGNWKPSELTFEGLDDYIIFTLDLNNYIGD